MAKLRSKNMARYFRMACVDGESRSHVPLKDYVKVPGQEFRQGRISDVQSITALVDAANKAVKNRDPKEPFPLIAQWGSYALTGPRSAQTTSNYPQNICFLSAAITMNSDGQLAMGRDGSAPSVPRGILGPQPAVSFADVDEYDRYLSQNPWVDSVQSRSWRGFIEYGEGLIRELCGDSPREEGYEDHDMVYLSYCDGSSGALREVISQYDRLERLEQNTPCFDTLVGARLPRELKVPAALDTIALRIGQMKGDFPLAEAQRDTLSATLITDVGDIVALNGPPGTGKTTLLQSVVACLFTRAALNEEPAPLIVAASANNQPVTNIIESFSGSAASDSTHYEPLKRTGLMKRWLPAGEKLTFGLYMASKSRAKTSDYLTEEKLVQLTHGPGLAATQECFIRAFSAAFSDEIHGGGIITVSDACRVMRQRLVDINQRIKSIALLAQAVDGFYRKYSGGLKELEKQVEELTGEVQRFEMAQKDWQAVVTAESFLQTLLSWFGPFKSKRRVQLDSFIADSGILTGFSEEQRSVITETIVPDGNWDRFLGVVQERLGEIQQILTTRRDELSHYRALVGDWGKVVGSLGLQGDASVGEVDERLDTTLRVEAFWLAVHLFEGRWISEMAKTFWSDPAGGGRPKWESKSPTGIAFRLRMYAMLSPCLVSTFHMLPSHMSGFVGKDSTGSWLVDSAWNEIDLLIVDEAGQIPPELAAGSFALAKRAIVVGDTLQIEPVWNVPEIVDQANVERVFGEGLFDEMVDKGRVASKGNVMRMAQCATPFFPDSLMGPGMHLYEHRRCTEPIIQYCNELCYHNKLEPRRFEKDVKRKELGLPAMGWCHVDGVGEIHGGSRRNKPEAAAIAEWIHSKRAHLEALYGKDIHEVLGVVTPFKAQAELIKGFLAGYNAGEITVGTVHALQGAERPVVVFSGVYCKNDGSSSYFFDRGRNMLNVAVSRAKDSFLVFGDMKIYQPDQATPSGMLARHLFKSPDNELKAGTSQQVVQV